MRVGASDAKMKHAKRLGTLLGSCMPFASKSWFQKETTKIVKKDEKHLEIKIETVCQHEHCG